MGSTGAVAALRRLAVGGLSLVALLGTALVITLLCYRVTPLLALAVPIGIGFLVLACVRPVHAVCATLLIAVTQGFALPLGGLGSLSTTECAFLALAGGWVWRALSGAPGVRYPQIADYPQMALVLALLPGLALGADVVDVVRLVLMWTAFFLVFLTVKGFSPAELRWVVLALGLGGGLLAGAGLITYLQGGGAVLYDGGSGVSGRAAFGIPDPNYYGGYLVLSAVPLAALVLSGRQRWRRVAAVAVGVSALGLVASLSRGAILAAALAAAVVVLAWSRTRVVSVAVLIAIGCATALNLSSLLESEATEVVSTRLSSVGEESSNNKRTLLWRETFEVVLERPEGVGALNFRSVSSARGLTERGDPLENVHNSYLNLAVELGVAGLLAYLLWCARVTWDLAVEWRRHRPQTFPLAVGLSGAFVGYSFQALTIVQYRVQSILATLFVLAGVAAAARAWPDPPPTEVAAPASSRRAGALA